MKVIDAHTGLEVQEGERIPMPGQRYYQVLKIYPGVFKAYMDAILVDKEGRRRVVRKQPLQVRWTHPGFFLQHVAFVPS